LVAIWFTERKRAKKGEAPAYRKKDARAGVQIL
jgi:hypothetical protein